MKARQAARPPTPLPQCQLFSAPLLSLFNHYRAIQSPGALAEGQYVIRPCKHSLTHSRFKFRKRFRFAVGDRSANANYPDPLSTTFWFRPMSAASLFFCNPASASRCRHPHPDGNVTLWHRIQKKEEEEEKLGSFQLPLPLRPAARGMNPQRFINSSEPSSSSASACLRLPPPPPHRFRVCSSFV